MASNADNFFYGATLLGHTVEGENYASDWWRWEQRPGRIVGGATSQTAAGHWDRFQGDAKIASTLGLNCLLISLEWSRIEPKRGEFDQDALDHYAGVLKALKKHEITPIVALQAITLPAWFADAGGWAQEDAVDMFAAYVDETARKLSPHCQYWVPLYRLFDSIELGYLQGLWAPGRTSTSSVRAIVGNTEQAVVRASEIILGNDASAQIGDSCNAPDVQPYDEESPWDYRAARALNDFDSFGTLDIPVDMIPLNGDPFFPWVPSRFELGDAIEGAEESLEEIEAQLSGVEEKGFHFLVVSMPARRRVRFAPMAIRRGFVQPVDENGEDVDFRYREPDVFQVSANMNPSYSEEISLAMEHCQNDPTPVLLVGGAHDFLDDVGRCGYMLDHIEAIDDLKNSGRKVMGYVHESFLDGFDWDRGYSTRRGLVHVDRETLARTPNQSAYLLGDIARQGGITPGAVRRYCPDWQSRLESVR